MYLTDLGFARKIIEKSNQNNFSGIGSIVYDSRFTSSFNIAKDLELECKENLIDINLIYFPKQVTSLLIFENYIAYKAKKNHINLVIGFEHCDIFSNYQLPKVVNFDILFNQDSDIIKELDCTIQEFNVFHESYNYLTSLEVIKSNLILDELIGDICLNNLDFEIEQYFGHNLILPSTFLVVTKELNSFMTNYKRKYISYQLSNSLGFNLYYDTNFHNFSYKELTLQEAFNRYYISLKSL
jgi:hypothetical protein